MKLYYITKKKKRKCMNYLSFVRTKDDLKLNTYFNNSNG